MWDPHVKGLDDEFELGCSVPYGTTTPNCLAEGHNAPSGSGFAFLRDADKHWT